MSSQSFTSDIHRDIAQVKKPTVPAVRQILKKYHNRLRATPGAIVLKIARELAKSNQFPPRLIAFELVAAHGEAFSLVTEMDLKRWSAGLSDWGNVDLLGCTIVGAAWRTGIITDTLIWKWAQSPDRWLRRLSLVATVPLNNKTRGGTGDPIRTLQVCRCHVDDRDDTVVKALSWALRELAKRDAPPVREFIKQHRAKLAPRVVREVSNKLTTGLKNPK